MSEKDYANILSTTDALSRLVKQLNAVNANLRIGTASTIQESINHAIDAYRHIADEIPYEKMSSMLADFSQYNKAMVEALGASYNSDIAKAFENMQQQIGEITGLKSISHNFSEVYPSVLIKLASQISIEDDCVVMPEEFVPKDFQAVKSNESSNNTTDGSLRKVSREVARTIIYNIIIPFLVSIASGIFLDKIEDSPSQIQIEANYAINVYLDIAETLCPYPESAATAPNALPEPDSTDSGN